ncbi:MAG TPA: CPBP family glutamic-type intramembrane protease, partial [Nitrososphaerales archaeon]|nr:CPBP family glutamic-type intramembrane protease [Nitrososphaerales archaeon]
MSKQMAAKTIERTNMELVVANQRFISPSKRKGIVSFVLIAFGMAWAVWIPLWLLGVPASSSIAQTLLILGAFSPAVSATIVRQFITREGFADAGLKPNFGRKWRYYLFSLLWPFLIIAGVVGVLALVDTVARGGYLGSQQIAAFTNFSSWASLIVGAIAYTPLLWGEEFGWRSYLQIRLFDTRPLAAAVTTGLIWGVWHYPALLAGLIPNAHGLLSLILVPWYMVWFSIVLGWLRLRMLRLLNHIFYRPDERFVHWLMVQPKDVDPVSDMSQFTSLPMAPAWKK